MAKAKAKAKPDEKRAAAAGEASSTELGAARRRDLLEAAYTLIAEKGLEGLRTRDIAARAGVNISTLHYYFGTKEALLVAIVAHVADKFGEARRDVEGSPATVRAHIEGAWRSFQDNPHLTTVLQELSLRARRDPAARAAFREVHEGWNLAVEHLVRQGVRDGQLRSDLDPRTSAFVVTSFVIGAMTQLGVNAEAFDFHHVSAELDRWLAPEPGERPRGGAGVGEGPARRRSGRTRA
ncbi:TetR/AcrR family transcriptional regulator [Sorangium sp. So ce131]|uniref:TetR/AcrR family transcriptional regulator n=1 Tax=Sorangium sp. So ce131 TaxID=3133282 RepID=UPI003F6313A4